MKSNVYEVTEKLNNLRDKHVSKSVYAYIFIYLSILYLLIVKLLNIPLVTIIFHTIVVKIVRTYSTLKTSFKILLKLKGKGKAIFDNVY